MDAIFGLRLLIEKHREVQKDELCLCRSWESLCYDVNTGILVIYEKV